MNEREFRQALKSSLTDMTLTDAAKQQTLRRMREPERTVHRMKKRWIAVACTLLLLTGVTAVATGTRWVNWQGEAVPDQVLILADTVYNKGMNFVDQLPDGELAFFVGVDEDGRQWGGMGKMKFRPRTLEDARKMVEAYGMLPWPERFPDGYSLKSALIVCEGAADARFALVKQETIDGRITVTYVSLPEESLVNSEYRLVLENGQGETIDIYLFMSDSPGYGFKVNEEDEAVALNLQGIDNALFIRKADVSRLNAFVSMDAPVRISRPFGLDEGQVSSTEYDNHVIKYFIESTDLTKQELLAIFGWHAE